MAVILTDDTGAPLLFDDGSSWAAETSISYGGGIAVPARTFIGKVRPSPVIREVSGKTPNRRILAT